MNSHEAQVKPRMQALYRQKGYWGDATLLDCWNHTVMRHPDKIAVVDAQKTMFSFKQADILAGRLASYLLESGVVEGDIVSVQIPGWAEFLLIYAACLKAGAVLSPVHTNLRCVETQFILKQCRSKVLFVPYRYRNNKYLPLIQRILPELPYLKSIVVVDKFGESTGTRTLAEIIDVDRPHDALKEKKLHKPAATANDLAAVLYTSGSEGKPKGVMLSHNNILASESVYTACYNFTQYDTMLMPAPVTHATGYLHGITAPLLVGATTILQDRLDPQRTLELIEQYRCTICAGGETFLHDMLCLLRKKSYDISSLRLFLSGGSPSTPTIIQEASGRGITVCNVYGSTESAPHSGTRPDDSEDRRLYTAGLPMPGIEVKVVDKDGKPVPPGVEGQEISRGPQVFQGYLNEPELTAKALDKEGWYCSGDRCVMDEAGYLRITGRIKDIIIRGGENISGLEVEHVLMRHPNIREAAAVAMPDPRLGERVCAYVLLEDPDNGLSFEEMLCFLEKQDIAKFKFPERLELIDRLPKTESGKIKKGELRRDIAEKLAKEKK